MIFSVDAENGDLEHHDERNLSSLGVLERQDIQEWAIEEPRILGEELLVVSAEYAGFEQTRDRLDILAFDPEGKLVVAELKRDRADRTTDLQALKYASYCATLTPTDVQSEYRRFWSEREGEPLTPEAVGDKFATFIDGRTEEEIPRSDDGWAEFTLDNKPRIVLAAGQFGIEITSPVMWLIEEYGVEIACVRIEAYKHRGRIVLNSQQIIPVAEAEEYMTKRREKDDENPSTTRSPRTITVLLEEGTLKAGDIVHFDREQVSETTEQPDDKEFWQGEITGAIGRSNNIEWLHDNKEYSFTGLSKQILHEIDGRDKDDPLNGYDYWHRPDSEQTLYELRK